MVEDNVKTPALITECLLKLYALVSLWGVMARKRAIGRAISAAVRKQCI